MANHICKEADYCICSSVALEPDERCPIHGIPWPPKCGECGKFMKWPGTKMTEEFYETF
jgi:hypothetical protein